VPVTTTLTGAHVDWGFVLVNDTKCPGLYKLDIADGVFAAGAWSAAVCVVCTGCDPVVLEFDLVPEAPLNGVVLANAAHGGAAGTLTLKSVAVSNGDAGAPAVTFAGTGTGNSHGLSLTSVAGHALALGAAGYAISASSTASEAILVATTGTNKDAIKATGSGTGAGMSLLGGATGPGLLSTGGGNHANGDGIRAVAGGASAVSVDAATIAGAITGNITGDITGNLSGTVGSVTGWAPKKNTALANFEFPMYATADHVTPLTGVTVTATRSIDGGAFGACANAVSEIGTGGVYKISLAAADLNGDVVMLKFTGTAADPQIITVVTTT